MAPKTREIRFGKHVFRIAETASGFEGIVVGRSATRVAAPDEARLVRKLTAEVMKGNPDFVGYDGARARFLRFFPGGFSDPGLDDAELNYKRDMVAWLGQEAPLDRAVRKEVEPATIARAFQRTNLPDRFTKAKVSSVLKGPKAGRLVEILAEFARGELAGACGALSREYGDDGVATWPVLTYLAFFWDPERHCFLKPEFTMEYARRVGHRFAIDYHSRPSAETYALLIDMIGETRTAVADLGPRDNIDLHSFMWAVCSYGEPA